MAPTGALQKPSLTPEAQPHAVAYADALALAEGARRLKISMAAA